MEAGDAILLVVAGIAAGAVNAAAGGGSLLSFPALLAVGYPPLAANATNMVAVLPGYLGGAAAYRNELRGQRERTRRLSVAAAAGGAVGAALLLASPAGVFESLVPFLVLGATALLAAQPLVPKLTGHGDRRGIVAATFLASVYGGYFGAALGVMLLAILALMTSEDLQRANAVKAVLSLVIGVVAAGMLAVLGPVEWEAAGVMALATLVGGRTGGALARRLTPQALRWAVVTVGVALAVAFFV